MTSIHLPLTLSQCPEWPFIREVPNPGPCQDYGRFGRVSVLLAFYLGGFDVRAMLRYPTALSLTPLFRLTVTLSLLALVRYRWSDLLSF